MTSDTTPAPVFEDITDWDEALQVLPRYSPVQLGTFTEAQVAGIEARVRYGALPWYRRWREPRPPTWAQTTESVR